MRNVKTRWWRWWRARECSDCITGTFGGSYLGPLSLTHWDLWLGTEERTAVRRTRLSMVGDRAFAIESARPWNSPPSHVTVASSLFTFRCRLKSHLFSLSYSNFWFFSTCSVPAQWFVILDTRPIIVLHLHFTLYWRRRTCITGHSGVRQAVLVNYTITNSTAM